MVFSSNVFLFLFLPLALLLYFASPRPVRFVVLTLTSYVFYAWSGPRFLILLLWTTAFDFTSGNLIGGHWKIVRRGEPGAPPRWFQRAILTISLTNSIGLLLFFKYAMLGQQIVNRWLLTFGREAIPTLAIVLPAGISFYTFESISYVVDIYRGIARPASEQFLAELEPKARQRLAPKLKAEVRSLIAFACYLAQFPHLVAGPIIRYQELEPQLVRPETRVDRFGRGVFFLSLGLAKKVLLANTVSRAADAVFSGIALSWVDAWWGVIAYAFQIYFDFCGYTDMAIGLALMMGFQFPRNFDAPYRAASITEFWRRWHMTLSRWLRDYLYIPLGGNRKGPGRTYVNLMITMLLGGLWHGASVTFAVWGLYHGAWLAIERAFGKRGIGSALPRPINVALTFVLVCIGWVMFRSESVISGGHLVVRLLVPTGDSTSPIIRPTLYDPQIVTAMLVSAGCAFAGIQTWDLSLRLTPTKVAFAACAFCAAALVLEVSSSNPFLYFRF